MQNKVSNENLGSVALKERVVGAVKRARDALLGKQQREGYWCYELEADSTIPSEYILMNHFMDTVDDRLEQKIGVYLRRRQNEDGGWPLYTGGSSDISCAVKAYYALKMIGDDTTAPHMLKARKYIRQKGGAARSNVFTRLILAMFEQIPWRGVPFIPVEIMLLPRWFFFHIYKVSYWSRAVMVPLFVLCTLKAKAKNPRGIGVEELFITPPNEERNYFPVKTPLGRVFLVLDKIGRLIEPLIPVGMRNAAMKKAEKWFVERLNGVDGLGAIMPAMVNAYEALVLLGYSADDPLVKEARESIERLVVEREDEAYCQPCVSPVWDTGLAALALLECGDEAADTSARRGLDWLTERQLFDEKGDWSERRPDLRGGGWAFQFENPHYPDLDDTAVVAMAMQLCDPDKYKTNIARAAEWTAGMQSENGGIAAFDVDNTYYYLNEIPFADHGALLDPPTSDVSARVLMFLSSLNDSRYDGAIKRIIDYLSKEQEADGSWFGRWGTNYIYGTWSVLIAFEKAGISSEDARVKKAVQWLKSLQHEDGGWGEDNDSYEDLSMKGKGYRSSAFQTAWALLALMAAGEVEDVSVRRGVGFLLECQATDGLWYDDEYTAPGFPRVFYLKYYGYDKYFPLWALAKYKRLQ